MRVTRAPFILLAAALCLGGCASSRRTGGPREGDRNVITQDQMLSRHFPTVFEAVQAIHANWLTEKGTDSFTKPTPVLVYLDDMKVGPVESLRNIRVEEVSWVTYIDGVAASARWGMGHSQGVIFLSSRPR
ncbi:MAG: hypothetical protein JWO05_2948 [Gemmatimonadetes bacterium]|nr:hypothetical protein [Gemmatimonadota bacterium]